jgi:hypothetical protein
VSLTRQVTQTHTLRSHAQLYTYPNVLGCKTSMIITKWAIVRPITIDRMKGDICMEFLGVLLYLVPVFAVLAFLNAVFRIARALESIAQSMKTMEEDQDM